MSNMGKIDRHPDRRLAQFNYSYVAPRRKQFGVLNNKQNSN